MFELHEPIAATLVSVTNRVERHGDDKVPAVSYGLKITSETTLLDLLDKNLRGAIYHSPRNKTIEGVDALWPTLRCAAIEHVSVNVGPFEGWTLNIDHGIDEETPVTLGACKIDKFRVTPIEGGIVELSLRVGTSDISAESSGLMAMMLGQEISITLIAPKVAPEKKATDGKPTLSPEAAWPFPKHQKTPEQALAESKP